MSERTVRLAAVTAGLSDPSSSRLLTDRLLAAVRRHLADAAVEVSVIELRTLAVDIANHLTLGHPSADLQQALDEVARADGVVAVTPIFNASYSGLFKSFFDLIEPGVLAGVPVLIGGTGGTERHSLALDHSVRPMMTYLHAVTVPTAVYAATSDWAASGTPLSQRIDRAAAEFLQLLPPAPRSAPASAQVVPFAEILASVSGSARD